MAENKNTQVAAQTSTEVAQKASFSTALTAKLDSVSDALPKDFNKARFVQNALALINDNPALQKYSQAQLMGGLLKGAYLGLDFYSKECYLIPYGNQLNYQTDYRGAKKLAKKYSIRPIKDIYSKLIREGDEFEELIINGEPTFNFKPKFLNDGKILGAFAVVLYKDGGLAYDVMPLSDLENTRKHSKASNSPAWKDFTGEMYKKTVLHRLCKQIEIDFENPTQRDAFMAGMEIETDVEAQVQHDIENHANQQEFIVEEPSQIEEKPAPKTVADVYTGVRDPVKKDADAPKKEKKDEGFEYPPFMKENLQ